VDLLHKAQDPKVIAIAAPLRLCIPFRDVRLHAQFLRLLDPQTPLPNIELASRPCFHLDVKRLPLLAFQPQQ
jgi:hypothetical protein